LDGVGFVLGFDHPWDVDNKYLSVSDNREIILKLVCYGSIRPYQDRVLYALSIFIIFIFLIINCNVPFFLGSQDTVMVYTVSHKPLDGGVREMILVKSLLNYKVKT
jgi:hypothetical protein